MVSFTNTVIATFAIVSLAQAGPIAAVVRGVSTVASIASSASNAKKHHRDVIRGESSIFERDDAAVQGNFASCVTALHKAGAPKPIITHDNGAVHLAQMPTACTEGVKNYNKLPNVATLNKAHGSATVTGPGQIVLKDMPEEFVKMLE